MLEQMGGDAEPNAGGTTSDNEGLAMKVRNVLVGIELIASDEVRHGVLEGSRVQSSVDQIASASARTRMRIKWMTNVRGDVNRDKLNVD